MRNSWRNRWNGMVLVLACILLGMLGACSDDVGDETMTGINRPDVLLEAERVDSAEDRLEEQDTLSSSDAEPADDIETPTDLGSSSDDVGPLEDVGTDDVVDEEGPTLYPSGRILSPITQSVADNLRAIAFSGEALKPDVFMKVGASSTVSPSNLHCFGGNHVQLDEYQDLQPAIDFFLQGDAAGTNPFERETLAAKIGMSAGWAFTGSPSPLEAEIAAIQPSYAFVHYGTNDMGLGTTYESALWKFGDHMVELSDELIAQGIIPVLMTIAARGDKASANRWVATYNAVIRAVAQSRQVPLLDLHYALEPLEGFGLAGDGIHLNTYKSNGSTRPCIFTEEGLSFGMNMRNLTSLMALDTLRWTVALEENVVEEEFSLNGTGTTDDPFLIAQLPFADHRDTLESGQSLFDSYPGCNAEQDESGTEYVYRLTLTESRHIRALVLDQGNTDIDIHLLDSSGLPTGCLTRDHQIIEATLEPGTYTFVLDTFVSAGTPMGGKYLFVLLECDSDDSSCKSLLLEDAP